jgi:protein HOOK3
VRELEIGATPNRATFQSRVRDSIISTADDDLRGLSGELDDALSGTTTTDLKIRIRKLEKELSDLKGNQGKEEESKILVLENLLDDARRHKSRYEADYLQEHRERLILQGQMEEIRAGRGDGGEAAIALRQRLNETVTELDDIKKKHTETEVKCGQIEKDLIIAKSDRKSTTLYLISANVTSVLVIL